MVIEYRGHRFYQVRPSGRSDGTGFAWMRGGRDNRRSLHNLNIAEVRVLTAAPHVA